MISQFIKQTATPITIFPLAIIMITIAFCCYRLAKKYKTEEGRFSTKWCFSMAGICFAMEGFLRSLLQILEWYY